MSPQVCTVCTHEDHHEINLSLVRRESYRDIAGHFSVAKSALQRHSKDHIPQLLLEASKFSELAKADDLIDEINLMLREAKGALEQAKAERQVNDFRSVLAAIESVSARVLELAKLRKIVDEKIEINNQVNTQVNVLMSPEWVKVKSVLVSRLEPYPEAKKAVVEGLREIKAA